jgi:thimet oligopeptidase
MIPRCRAALAALGLAAACGMGAAAQSRAPGVADTTHAWRLRPADLAASCRAAIDRARHTIDSTLARPDSGSAFSGTIRPVEEAVGAFFTTVSEAGALYLISPDAALRDSSAACSKQVTNFAVEIGANPGILAAAKRAQAESLTTPADHRLVQLYIEAGRKSGAGLDSATRSRVTGLFKRLADLQRDYAIAVAADSTHMDFAAADTLGLPPQLRASLVPAGAGFRIRVEESTRLDFLGYQRNPDVRRQFYLAYYRRGGPPNIERLEAAVAIRDTLAHLLGFPTWAAYQLDTKMAKDPARVVEFLHDIDVRLLSKAKTELAALAPLARRDGRPIPVAHWDYYYYQERLRRTRYALDAEEVRQYFPVDHVVASVMDLYTQLLGIEFEEQRQPDVWAPGVRVFGVRDRATQESLGRLYLDLFPRPNKFEHFADFGLRSARRLPDGSRQLPFTAIIGNWPAAAPGKPSLLSHDDVVAFFHEFGHAMAAVLNASPYATTGENGLRQDFVEAPSQMLENWMWQPEVLERVSHHVKTGRPLPHALIRRMIALKRLDNGYTWTRQAFFAMYDMVLHTSGPSVDPTALWSRLSPEMTPFTMADSTLPAAAFGHLMSGYDAGMYGYLWSKVYAQDMFTRFERDGIMSEATGRAYREQILEAAGTEEPGRLVERFLGRPLSYEAFYREIGIGDHNREATHQ